jgi:hypothetical protein
MESHNETTVNGIEYEIGPKAKLSNADLSRAGLNDTNLVGADLVGANLSKANLVGADLSKANLVGADLFRANQSKTYLAGADLTGANLLRMKYLILICVGVVAGYLANYGLVEYRTLNAVVGVAAFLWGSIELLDEDETE